MMDHPDTNDSSATLNMASGKMQMVLRPRNMEGALQPEYPIDHYPTTIGRHPTNDIELPFEAISRYHARIELHAGRPRVVDLRSSNGMFINGDRVQTAFLQDQDSVSFGGLEFTVTIQERAPDTRSRSSEANEGTSVHFILEEESSQSILHAELPEDTSGVALLQDEITGPEQLKKAKQQLITLYRLQESMRASGDEKRMLRRVLELLFAVLPVDRGVILMRDPYDATTFRPVAIKVKPGIKEQQIGISKTILHRCQTEKVAILTRDAPQDRRFDSAESVVIHRMRSVLCVPLISVRQIFGFCHLDTTDAVRSFTEEDLTFMVSVASEVATHLHNMRMLNEKIATERMTAIGQTITGMAHNIKNILVLTQGGIEMMEKRLKQKNYETLEETWEVVRRSLGRVNGLVQDMLDYSRARTVEKSRVDINAMLQVLHASFADQFAKDRIRCHMSLDEACPAMMLDADGLEKALVNLIVNATEALPDRDGTLWLRTTIDDDKRVVIEVEDNGMGIPEEIIPRIFVPFFTTKGSKGSGLGLAMTRKFIEDMGGRIDVQSRQGQGTTFRITLRGAAIAKSDQDASSGEWSSTSGRGGGRK
jgi:signal transduction histidine kinase